MAKTSLPPGFRFHPTDVELVWYYLKRKVMGKPFRFEVIAEIELYKFAPWDLPDKSYLGSRDLEWYFFCPRDRKYANGTRTNRATDIGYWKTTGKDRSVIHNFHTVGMKKTLIFHVGKAPSGDRTNWVMYEYRLEAKELADSGFAQDAYVICKIFQKSGPGPKIGEQYGAPFKEEDWEDDTAIEHAFSFPCITSSSAEPLDNQAVLLDPVCQHSVASGIVGEMSSAPDVHEADGILLEQLEELLYGSPLYPENADGEMFGSAGLWRNNVNEVSSMDKEGIYDELEDLSALAGANTMDYGYALQPMPSETGNEHFMELNDLCFLDTSDPSELVLLNDLYVQNSFPHCPSSQNLYNIHDPTSCVGSVITTASVLSDSLALGSGISGNQSVSLALEMEKIGRSAPQINAPAYSAHCSGSHLSFG